MDAEKSLIDPEAPEERVATDVAVCWPLSSVVVVVNFILRFMMIACGVIVMVACGLVVVVLSVLPACAVVDIMMHFVFMDTTT